MMTQYQAVSATDVIGRSGAIKLHGPEAFEGMRRAGRAAAEVLDLLAPFVVPGATVHGTAVLVGVVLAPALSQ